MHIDQDSQPPHPRHRLIVRCVPEKGESLYGWAVRLAAANGYKDAASIFELASNVTTPSDFLIRLAGLVDCSPQRFSHFNSEMEITANVVRPSSVICKSARQVRCIEGQLKVCPGCLAKKQIVRSVWTFDIWEICPDHQCKLISRCPKCGNLLSRKQQRVTHCGSPNCEADLRTTPQEGASLSPSRILSMLSDLSCEQQSARFPQLPLSFRNAPPHALACVIDVLVEPVLKHPPDRGPESPLLRKLKIAEEALRDWPYGFHQHLDHVRVLHLGYAAHRRTFFETNLLRLFKSLSSPELPISDKLREALKREFISYAAGQVRDACMEERSGCFSYRARRLPSKFKRIPLSRFELFEDAARSLLAGE